MLPRVSLSVACILLITASARAQTVWYVDDDGVVANGCTSWEDACPELQAVLSVAKDDAEIWVAEGIYKPDYDIATGQHTADRTATFQLITGVALRGGYLGLSAGQGEDPNERNIELYETVLSGDLIGDDGPMPFAGNEENSFHIVTGSGTNATAVLDGFTITGGNADGESPHHRGGGMTNEGGSPTVLNCLFKGNAAEGTGFFSGGGGMSNWSQSDATIVNCTFLGNMTATRGGGMRNYHSQPEITNCLFIGNSSADRGGALSNHQANSTISNSTFSQNSAVGVGGGMYAVLISSLTNCIFWDNSDNGGKNIDESAQIHIGDHPGPILTFSCIQGLVSGGDFDNGTNISDDPLFADPASGDLHLQDGSPCIDAGDPLFEPAPEAVDMDGEPRVQYCQIDLGADESTSFADCNDNASADACEVTEQGAPDCNENLDPDECELVDNDCNSNLIPDDCEADCNMNLIPDDCDIANGTSEDADDDGVPDECPCLPGELAKLTSSDAADFDHFGGSVSISGNVILVGADDDDHAGLSSGSAYVYRFDGSEWVEEAKLTASDAGPGDRFGHAVFIDGELALIGAWLNNETGLSSGAVYVYRFDGSHWNEETKLTADDTDSADLFGSAVAMTGNVAVIGAPGNEVEGINSAGSAYIFTLTGSSWQEAARLNASEPTTDDRFGSAVSIAADTVVIGAPREDDAALDAGSVYVFRFEGSQWIEEAKIVASDAEEYDAFGTTVANTGDMILVGSPMDDGLGENAGAAYVYRLDPDNPGTWLEEAKITSVLGAADDRFGTAVGVEGNVAVIGAWRDSDAAPSSGAALAFYFNGLDWNEDVKMTASDAAPGDSFGGAVAINNGSVVVGASYVDGAEDDSGAAYVFGGLADCNANGVLDSCDISEGTSQDFDGNVVPDECEARLDIKPTTCPNPVNRHSNGVLPVGLLGAAHFDVTQVDLSTLQLSRADGVGGSLGPNEGPPGPHSVFEDVATPFDGEACECHDLGGNGIDDLSMKFRTDELVEAFELDALPGGAVVELVLTGSLLDGTPFAASDCIVIVPPGDMSPTNAHVESNVADTFVEVAPLDLNFDDDGFASFSRSYYSGTAMTLSAPPQSAGRRFVRWLVEGAPQPIGMRTVEVIVSAETTLKAVYARPARPTPEHRPESDDPLE